jgi:hypothetical protein
MPEILAVFIIFPQPRRSDMRHMARGTAIVLVLLTLLILAASTPLEATSVTVILEDQYGQEISGSMIHVSGIGTFPSGSVAEIPEGTHSISLWPTLAGGYQPAYLSRAESGVEVTASTTELRFQWLRANVLYSVIDQTGAEITGTYVLVKGLGATSIWYQTGDSVWLPITDETVYPTISGIYTDGYDLTIIPTLPGGADPQKLARSEYEVEVTCSTTELEFEWQRAYKLYSVTTQFGTEITGSFIGLVGMGSSSWRETGQTVPLPVNDPSLYPSLSGDYADGYDFHIMPYLGTASQAWLSRRELGMVINTQSEPGVSPLAFEWLSAECEVLVAREDGTEIEGSAFSIIHDTFATGTVMVLPTTDETLYPGMSGQVIDGFTAAIYPGGGGYGQLVFEVYPTPALDAEVVEIQGQMVTLALGSCVGATGTLAGTVLYGSGPLGGVTVDLFDDQGDLLASVISDLSDGHYAFGELDAGGYTVEIVLPLGYAPAAGFPVSVPVTIESGVAATVDFCVEQIVTTAEARSAGYWKHQYKVHDSGKGHAQESIVDLETYQSAVYGHFYNRTDEYVIQIETVTHSGGDVLVWQDALSTLSSGGNGGMDMKAHSQFLALLLNVVSGKIGQYHEVTADGMTVSQAITFVADLLSDTDTSTDELAKDIAEQVNQNHQIAAGTIPESTPMIAYGQGRGPANGVAFGVTPNPAAVLAELHYYVPTAGSQVLLQVYDISGRLVRRLVDCSQSAGAHRVIWQVDDEYGNAVAAGVYFYRLEVNAEVRTLKAVIIRQ